MTQDEWDEIERILYKPEVQIAMRGRCEEQGHQYVNGADFFPLVKIYMFCRWCSEKK